MTDSAKIHPRDAFIAAGKVLYPRYGYRRLSVRLLAAEAGLSPGMFHHLFADKESFVAAVLQQKYDEGFAQMRLQVRPGYSERDNLRSALFSLACFAREHLDWIVRVFADSAEIPAVCDFIRHYGVRHLTLLMNLLDRAERRGALIATAPAQRTSFLMSAIVAPLLIGSQMKAAGILPDVLAARFEPEVMSDAAIAQRIDWVLATLFNLKETP